MGQDDATVSVSAPVANERVVEILRAACRVIARDGAHGLRMESVARETGVSKALVHYYFSTRQELLKSAFDYSEELTRRAVEAELASLATGRDRAERFLALSVDDESLFDENRALWNEVWSSMRFDRELRPSVEHHYGEWLDWLVGLIDEGRGDGSIAAGVDARETGWRLAAIADGVDSMLYLGLLDRERARELVHGSFESELRR
jgi:AcrR family transcriptional regulator